jgi:hypothetical protein
MCDWGSVNMSDNPLRSNPVRWVSLIMATVVGLTFLFAFGNVLNLALRLGVPAWIAPLIAPAVDLSVLGLLVATRHLAVHGVPLDRVRPARRLLLFSSVVTLALNVTDPLIAGHIGRAVFDAVGPLLLIGWAEVGPGLLQEINAVAEPPLRHDDDAQAVLRDNVAVNATSRAASPRPELSLVRKPDELIALARMEDAQHWAAHRRPISAETLRKRLRVGTARSRSLVAAIRSDRYLEALSSAGHAGAMSATGH